MRVGIKTSIIFLVIFSSWTIQAEEYFGEFKGELKGTFINADPRPIFELTKKYEFKDPNGLLWTVPANKKVDGASIPPAFWSFIGGPFSGRYINASVIHDYYCDEKTRTEHDTHRNFYYGMRANGVSEWKAKFMHWVVATFGPKWKLEARVVQNLTCTTGIGIETLCSSVPKIEMHVIEVQNIDLEDPTVLAAVLSKASSVARTLKTSDGKFLDISDQGYVPSSFVNISQSANKYRTLFSEKTYLHSPEKLGVLSKWDVKELNSVEAWNNNKLPAVQDAMVIQNNNLNLIKQGRDFKLDTNGIELLNKQLDMKSLELEMKMER